VGLEFLEGKQKAVSKRVLNGILASIGLLILAGGAYLAHGLFSDMAQVSALSNSQEILSYYAAAQERHRSKHGAYGTMRQLLDGNMLYLGALGDIKWAEEMTRHRYRFRFSVSEKKDGFVGEAKPLDPAARRLKEFRVSSP
jgi:hypothetical protein